MIRHTTDEQSYLNRAIKTVTDMLTMKRDIWTHSAPVFECFDIHESLGVSPIQWALTMCNLKLSRIKTCFTRHQFSSATPYGFVIDTNAEDTLVDLASYALLTLGLIYRQRATLDPTTEPSPERSMIEQWADQYLQTPEGKEEVAALAQEMLGQGTTITTDTVCGGTTAGREEIARVAQELGGAAVPVCSRCGSASPGHAVVNCTGVFA